MKRYVAIISCLLLLAAAGSAPLAPRLQPVVVSAGQFGRLAGMPRERLALMVSAEGVWRPVPFQVDPRDARGFVFGASTMASATPTGTVGEFDEIAFMASDLGEHSAAPPGPGPAWEVEVSVGGGKRYAYLWLAPGAPPRSKADYVSYKRDAQRERVTTTRYVQAFVPEAAFFSDLQVLPPDGDNRDMYDRLKMRSRVTTVGGINITYNETEFHSKVTGLRDGPVRVIRQNRTVIDILPGLKTPEVLVDEIFWRDSFEVPSELRLPYGADLVINEFYYHQGCDLLRSSGPFTFQSDAGGPVKVDGKMSAEEKALAASGADHRWGMVSGPAGSVFYISEWFNTGSKVKIRQFYRDDAGVADGTESEPGDSMYGIRLENGLALSGAGQRLNIRVFILPRGTTAEEAKGLLRPVSARIKNMAKW